jgi:protein-disulfide isomerase
MDNDPEIKKSSQLRAARVLDVATNLVVLVVATVLLVSWAQNRNSAPRASAASDALPTEPIALDDAPVRGRETAKVGILAFGEFECPYCSRFHRETFPSLQKDYLDTGKVFYSFRHLPLTKLHKFAEGAAEASECAGRQNRFWEFHDALFESPRTIAPEHLVQKANAVGLDQDLFAVCLQSRAARERVERDQRLAERLQIRGTPVFLIGRRVPKGFEVLAKLSGAKPIADFQRVLDQTLSGAM